MKTQYQKDWENKVQYDNREDYNKRIKSVAWKFRVQESEIRKLSLKFTLSEIEKTEKINGVIVCTDEIKMTLPKSIQESMFSYQCRMV